jgi:hypothetical protein
VDPLQLWCEWVMAQHPGYGERARLRLRVSRLTTDQLAGLVDVLVQLGEEEAEALYGPRNPGITYGRTGRTPLARPRPDGQRRAGWPRQGRRPPRRTRTSPAGPSPGPVAGAGRRRDTRAAGIGQDRGGPVRAVVAATHRPTGTVRHPARVRWPVGVARPCRRGRGPRVVRQPTGDLADRGRAGPSVNVALPMDHP